MRGRSGLKTHFPDCAFAGKEKSKGGNAAAIGDAYLKGGTWREKKTT